MKLASVLRASVAALMLVTNAHAAIETQGVPTFTGKKEVNFWNVKFFKGAKRVIIPTATVKMTIGGAAAGQVSRGGNVAKAKVKYVVTGLDKAFLQSLAKKAYDNAVESFRAAGWEVLTFDDIKSEADVVKLDKLAVDEKWGLPVDKVAGHNYAIAFPTDEMNMKGGFTGLHWALRGVAKDKEAVVYIPSYQFEVPQFWVETSRGYATSSVEVKKAPGVTIMPSSFMNIFLNHKAAGGTITNAEQYVHLADNTGVFEKYDDKSPNVANALSVALSHLTGSGTIDKGVWVYNFAVDTKILEPGVIGTITNFNKAAAEGTVKFLEK